MGQESISHQSSKDSFGYYATCVPCRRCARRHRRWLQAPLTSSWHFRFRFFLPWRVERFGGLRVPHIGQWRGQARLPCRISGAVGLRANHGKRPFARKSHSWTLAIGSYRTSLVDIAPAMKASGATYPCAHAQVDEKAGNVSGCVAESACCRKLSAQPCQHSNHHYLFRWPMKPSLRHAGNHSGFLVRFNRLRLEFALIAGCNPVCRP